MARRTKPESGAEPGLPQRYEGPQVLTDLLSRAGSLLATEEVAERFRLAQARGQERSDVIPSLFPQEPRFPTPDEARRLYANLFALWSRVAAGFSAAEDAPEPGGAAEGDAEPPLAPPQPLPPRGSAPGSELPLELVEAVWKHLDALHEREQRRLRHRFEAAQPDLAAWLDAVQLSDIAAITAQDLVFETWAMFDVAFGDRVRPVPFAELRALKEPPPLEASQPALAGYVTEVLEMLADEDPSFDAAARAQVERVTAAVAAALAGGLEEE